MDRSAKISAMVVAAIAVAIDQSSKGWALSALGQAGGHVALPGPVDFTLSFNESNAFGLAPVIGHATRWFLMSANLAAAMLILYVIATRQLRPLTRLGLALRRRKRPRPALDRLGRGFP